MKSKHGFITTKKRSDLMRKIKSKNTTPEIKLRKALWSQGVRYRIKNKSIPGKPDIVIKKYKLAVFVDGEFWHGYNWLEKKHRIKSNRDYWIKKIEGNIERDKRVNKELNENGWTVLRYWQNEIKKDLDKCVSEIIEAISEAVET
jgi:DNA mismatch endonuclease (patch repair protein)